MDSCAPASSQACVVSIRGVKLRLAVSSSWERFRADTASTKEVETLDWIDRYFGPGDRLIDVGANIGLYTVYAAMKNPAGSVVACEPAAQNLVALHENVALNRLTQVTTCGLACDRASDLRWLYMSSSQRGSSMHSLVEDDVRAFGMTVSHRSLIYATSLDAISNLCGRPTMIKIDVDGQEQAVLDGAAGVLSSRQLRTLLIECNWTTSCSIERIALMLAAHGFQVSGHGPVRTKGAMYWQNVIYER